jgi:methylmalonyl-CoA mutase C-terminal domain/subunit
VPKLLTAGAAAVFPTGTSLDALVREIRSLTGSNPELDLKGTVEPCASE